MHKEAKNFLEELEFLAKKHQVYFTKVIVSDDYYNSTAETHIVSYKESEDSTSFSSLPYYEEFYYDAVGDYVERDTCEFVAALKLLTQEYGITNDS